jgi:hypothetical protein
VAEGEEDGEEEGYGGEGEEEALGAPQVAVRGGSRGAPLPLHCSALRVRPAEEEATTAGERWYGRRAEVVCEPWRGRISIPDMEWNLAVVKCRNGTAS